MEKYILFGAGLYGKKAVKLLGRDRIEMVLDNDSSKWGTFIEGICVCNPEEKKELLNSCSVIISVSKKYQSEVDQQLRQWNVKNIKTFSEAETELRKRKIEGRTDYIKVYDKALGWIKNNTVDGNAIICTTDNNKSYPEVTGYYIPTLIQWGYRELAVSYAFLSIWGLGCSQH